MEVIHFNMEHPIQYQEPIVACIGYFDGIHIGHQKLIQTVLDVANTNHIKPALITFEPDPWVVLKGIREVSHITPLKHREDIVEALGIELLIVLDFDHKMARLSYEQFHQFILSPLHLHTLVCGFDFHYGYKGKGNIETLKKQNDFQVHIIEEIKKDHKKISSSAIENAIIHGDMEFVYECMGRYYEMRGTIIQGNQMGRLYGFPTANLKLNDTYILPKIGVYIGIVHIDHDQYYAIINIGHNPSFNYQQNVSIEANILDFDENIYDKEVSFQFCKMIRDEKRFSGMEALKQQLMIDTQTARDYRKKNEG